MEEPKTQPEEDFYYSADPTPLNEILGAAPGWLLRSGIGIVAFFVFVLLGGSMLFQYPDIIEAPVVVQADNPPVNLVAANNGKMERIFHQEGEYIRLSNFPYQEFGVLQGEVMHVSVIPAGEHYPVQIHLNNQLQTSYHTNLGHHVMLDGVAQIITEDISLYNRMINPLRSLRRNR